MPQVFMHVSEPPRLNTLGFYAFPMPRGSELGVFVCVFEAPRLKTSRLYACSRPLGSKPRCLWRIKPSEVIFGTFPLDLVKSLLVSQIVPGAQFHTNDTKGENW